MKFRTKLNKKIVHLTSAHLRYDMRIFTKMCLSLKRNGFDVAVVFADGKGDEVINGVSIFDVGLNLGGRLSRMTKTSYRVLKKAKNLDADVYHIHDPELIPVGLVLKKLGKKVIFDAHEDLPKQLLAKPYLNKYVKLALSKIAQWFEVYSCQKFDAVVCATPLITEKFSTINSNTVNINNFAFLNEYSENIDWAKKPNEAAYVGDISKFRGIKEVITAIQYTQNLRLNLAGNFTEKEFEVQIKMHKGWSKVNDLGYLTNQNVKEVLARSKMGLVTLHPIPNYKDALPVKMFEYMAAGIPVIASNFTLWQEIIEGNECGICVNPLETRAINKAIRYLIDNPKIAQKMGENGRQAVKQKYNWAIEEKKLFRLYERVLQ